MPEDVAEKPIAFQSDTSRRRILLSYWVVVLLGIPLWWVTTSLTRLPLPESSVRALESKQLTFVLGASIEGDSGLSKRIEEHLHGRLHDLQLDETLAVSISSSSEVQNPYAVTLDTTSEETRLDGRRVVVGLKDNAAASYSRIVSDLLESLWFSNFNSRKQVVQYAPRYRLAFSLLNEDSSDGSCPQSWDIEHAIARYIQPTLDKLSILHNFTVESQVQYFAPLAFAPLSLSDGSFGLTQEQLSVFVNSAEWTLSSSVSSDPILHFLIFVPSAKRRPLHILDAAGSPILSTAFSVPQWGSIFIYNPQSSSDSSPANHLSSSSLNRAFTIFRAQLLSLLGVPPLPSGVVISETDIEGRRSGFSDWQLDALMRKRALENAEESKETLGSIVRLVNQIENMPVGKDVTEDVKEALDALDKAYSSRSLSPFAALTHSARALVHASKAFFNPGMLALLYFPPEHNLAVYTPLLAPISAPLIANLVREVKKWRRSKRDMATMGR